MRIGKRIRGLAVFSFVSILALSLPAAPAFAQAAVTHYLGSITIINGDTLTVKTDKGDLYQVQVPSTAQLKRIEPGQTDLTKAEPMDFKELATGDRVLVNIDPNSAAGTPQALRVVAIKQADVAKKQAEESAAWSQGVHGLVKSIDAGSGAIVVNTRAGTVTKTITVNTTQSTSLKRYAQGSVSFNEAQLAPLAAIHPGDQIFVLGAKNADGTQIAAQAIVSGSFRSIAGTVLAVDATASTISVKDLSTKKPVTVRITADAQLRRLDDRMASMIAARLKGNQAGGAGRGGAGGGGANGAGNGGGGGGGFRQGGGGGGGGDLESILDRAQPTQLSSLQKNEAVMIVATEDATGINAIKLLAGVEPLLEAPEAQDLLASWSLNQGGGDAGQ
jgi:ribosomal protein L21E